MKTAEKHPERNKVSVKEYEASNTHSAEVLHEEVKWVEKLLHKRIQLIQEEAEDAVIILEPPVGEYEDTPYLSFITKHNLSNELRLLMAMAITSATRPDVYSVLLEDSYQLKKKYNVFGGIVDRTNEQFRPTLKTFIYLVKGIHPIESGELISSALYHNPLTGLGVIDLESILPNENTPINFEVKLTEEYFRVFSGVQNDDTVFGKDFPASKIESNFEWEDLILPQETLEEIEDAIAWIQFKDELYDNIEDKKRIKNGYPMLFHGPPGTGKTMAAGLIGKLCGLNVFQIDLSRLVSKYIGETEKNLGRLFDKAEDKNWILFFDEADSLFSKRGQVKDANDKYANQEMSFLLQRMEQFSGVTILTTNFVNNIDPAMTRRFQNKVFFPKPTAETLVKLWKKSLPKPFEYSPNLDWDTITKLYDITGANIANIVKFICIKCMKQKTTEVSGDILQKAVIKEYKKEGRSPNPVYVTDEELENGGDMKTKPEQPLEKVPEPPQYKKPLSLKELKAQRMQRLSGKID